MPPTIRRSLTAHQKRLVAARAKWVCAMCGQLLDETYEIDHVIALSLGGEDTIENCAPLHAACHRKKTLMDETWRLHSRDMAKSNACAKAPLQCLRCSKVVSPYFLHRCP